MNSALISRKFGDTCHVRHTPVFGRQLHRLPEDEQSSQSPSHLEGVVSCQGAESGCGELPGRCVREKSAPRQTELGAKAEPIQTLHLEQVIRREQFTPRHPAQGNLKLEGTQHGVTIVTTMACSVSGLGTVVNGGTEMGPAVVERR